jgi:hypothetical protein
MATKISEAAPRNNEVRGGNDDNSKSNKEGKDNKGNRDGNRGDKGGAATTANGNEDSARAHYYTTIN